MSYVKCFVRRVDSPVVSTLEVWLPATVTVGDQVGLVGDAGIWRVETRGFHARPLSVLQDRNIPYRELAL